MKLQKVNEVLFVKINYEESEIIMKDHKGYTSN